MHPLIIVNPLFYLLELFFSHKVKARGIRGKQRGNPLTPLVPETCDSVSSSAWNVTWIWWERDQGMFSDRKQTLGWVGDRLRGRTRTPPNDMLSGLVKHTDWKWAESACVDNYRIEYLFVLFAKDEDNKPRATPAQLTVIKWRGLKGHTRILSQ